MAQLVKKLPANAGDIGDTGLILGWEDPLEKEMATHYSILAWEIPWTEEPGGLNLWSCKESDRPEKITLYLLLPKATRAESISEGRPEFPLKTFSRCL